MSGLVRQILLYNFISLLVLMLGLFYVSRFQEDLVDARKSALLEEASIVGRAIADLISDPEKNLPVGVGASQTAAEESPNDENLRALASEVLAQLLLPSRTQAQVYDYTGKLILESGELDPSGRVRVVTTQALLPDSIDRLWESAKSLFGFEPTRRITSVSNLHPELRTALLGRSVSTDGFNRRGERVILAAVPVQQFHTIVGALVLTTQGGDIDTIVQNERIVRIGVFLVAFAITTFLCIVLARTIARPIRLLAETADSIRASIANRRINVPDLSRRGDEIGVLSASMRQMTQALYDQIDAVASFGADVAHELKNPLTSLRSALETMMLTDKKESQERLKEVIMDDLRRIDRLITDISASSRLGAEMAKSELERLDVRAFLRAIVGIYNRVENAAENDTRMPHVRLVGPTRAMVTPLFVSGVADRLGQVIRNLIDNALSFSPPDGIVRIAAMGFEDRVEIIVEDDGPGIPEDALERIFQRFYTDRPEADSFGKNSGLGLSISRQIIETHRGTIYAENRGHPESGARFIINLPRVS